MSESKLQLALNHALSEHRIAAARMGLLGGNTGLDAKRSSAWCEYGFPEKVTYDDLVNLYERGGLAHGAVSKLVSRCWATNPEIFEGDEDEEASRDTAFDRAAKRVFTRRIWSRFREADARRLVGRWAGLVLHIADSGVWGEPVTRPRSKLEKVTPTWAGALEPVVSDQGEITAWEYKDSDSKVTKIHPDRIFIFGDRTPGAIAWLQPAYNNFVSIEKIEGGSGETFLKNAARHLSIDFDKEVNLGSIAATYGVKLDELQEAYNAAARAINQGIDSMLITQGARVSPIVASSPDPLPHYQINLSSACAALGIPERILIGNQSGERASTEDIKEFNATCQSRRINQLSEDIEDFVSHLMQIKVLDAMPTFSVWWDDLNESQPGEKVERAGLLMAMNAQSPGEPIFTRDEIRIAAGYDPLEEPLLDDYDDDEAAEKSE